MSSVRRIVVGTDFSEGAEQALLRAVALAADWGASVVLAHAYEDQSAQPRSDRQDSLRAHLDALAARSGAAERGVEVETVLRRGAPWEKLLNLAADSGADLIVVGSRGQRGELRGGLLGSVTTRLVAMSCRAVLVVPPDREPWS